MVALKSRLNRGLNIEKPEKFNNFRNLFVSYLYHIKINIIFLSLYFLHFFLHYFLHYFLLL
jgi:hypothetical protein